mmetsp:Transcript_22944/g.57998  ORF Transcript_22944/g.57998 Transcript_22944/m.57998 type:complete len:272 (-) Transcript_22944:1765-2580(-)
MSATLLAFCATCCTLDPPNTWCTMAEIGEKTASMALVFCCTKLCAPADATTLLAAPEAAGGDVAAPAAGGESGDFDDSLSSVFAGGAAVAPDEVEGEAFCESDEAGAGGGVGCCAGASRPCFCFSWRLASAPTTSDCMFWPRLPTAAATAAACPISPASSSAFSAWDFSASAWAIRSAAARSSLLRVDEGWCCAPLSSRACCLATISLRIFSMRKSYPRPLLLFDDRLRDICPNESPPAFPRFSTCFLHSVETSSSAKSVSVLASTSVSSR